MSAKTDDRHKLEPGSRSEMDRGEELILYIVYERRHIHMHLVNSTRQENWKRQSMFKFLRMHRCFPKEFVFGHYLLRMTPLILKFLLSAVASMT